MLQEYYFFLFVVAVQYFLREYCKKTRLDLSMIPVVDLNTFSYY